MLIYVTIASTALRPPPVLAISLSDALKPSSARAVRMLQGMGIEVSLLTGDRLSTALVVAQHAVIKPEGMWGDMSPKGSMRRALRLHGRGWHEPQALKKKST